MSFSIFLNDEGMNFKPKYEWTISQGKIIEGQGKSRIVIDTTGLENTTITATVEVKGLSENCLKIFSGDGLIDSRKSLGDLPIEYDEILSSNKVEKLNRIAIEILRNQQSVYFIFSVRKNEKRSLIKTRVKHIFQYLDFYKVERNKISFDICRKKINKVEFTLIPLGAMIPNPDNCRNAYIGKI